MALVNPMGPPGVPGPKGDPGPAGMLTLSAATTFPSAPADSAVFSLLADDTNGVEWLFRYSQAHSQWRFIGGPALTKLANGVSQTIPTTYAAIANAPSITLPSTGSAWDFDILFGFSAYMSTSGWAPVMGLSIAGGAPVYTATMYTASGAETQSPVARTPVITGIAPGAVIQSQFKMNAAVTTTIGTMWMSLTPRSVTP